MSDTPEKAPKESKKFLAYVAAVVIGVVAGVADALLQKYMGIGITEQMWDFIGGISYTYLGVQGAVDVGVRVSAILKGRTTKDAIEVAKAGASAEVAAMDPADKSDALSDLK